MFVERAEDTPLCIVTPDFSNNEEYHTLPIEDDPFENIGFISTFSTWSMELAPLYTSTTSSFCGYLAELERLLLNPLSSTSGDKGASAAPSTGSHSSMVDTLRAYFQILEVSSLLGLDRDISDHAVQLFRDCSSAACMRNRNVEALATASLVQASREAKKARTLQEISTAANVSQKELHRYMNILTDALKLSQPINTNSIAVYMPRFCDILELEKSTQDLATHIGDVFMNRSFCTRRNPISISAGAIYLSCQLEDKRKTQTEICKATALTEVTLRKVYKELLENIGDLLPANYSPVVPLEKAFPGLGSSSSRVLASQGAGLGSSRLPLPSFAKPTGGMDSTDSPHVGEDVNTSSCLTVASVVEHLGLLNTPNKTWKPCSKKPMVVSNDETCGLVGFPSGRIAAKASEMSAVAIGAIGKAAPPNSSTMQHQFKNFRDFFQDAFPASAVPATRGLTGPSAPQGAGHFSSNQSGFHHAESLYMPVRDGPCTVPIHCKSVADKEPAKATVVDSLTIHRQTEEVDNRCTSERVADTTSPWPSDSQGFHKGLWDLNLAISAPEDCVSSPDSPTWFAPRELGA